jgi:hypothetical protein
LQRGFRLDRNGGGHFPALLWHGYLDGWALGRQRNGRRRRESVFGQNECFSHDVVPFLWHACDHARMK